MNSPGNVAINTIKPLNNTIVHSPIRATFDSSAWTPGKPTAVPSSNFHSMTTSKKDILPSLGLPPSGKRHRNLDRLPEIAGAQTLGVENFQDKVNDSLRMAGQQIDRDRISHVLSSKKNSHVGSHKRSTKEDKDAIRSQILNHLVERVKDHDERKSRRSSQKGSDVFSRLKIDLGESSGSKGSKRLGLQHRHTGSVNDKMFKTGFEHFDNSPVAKHYY